MAIHIFWFVEPKDNKHKTYQFSNQEILKNFQVEFSKYDDVVWHHSNARGRVTANPNDILIGHPPWPPRPEDPYANWVFDNGLDGPGSAHPNCFVVMPWVRAAKVYSAIDPYIPMVLASRAIFGMGGITHYDENVRNAAADTGWRRTQHKLVRINMGCDARLLPARDSTMPRRNGLLHVSSLMNYKRPELMLKSLPAEGCTLYIGTKRMDLVKALAAQGVMKPNVSILGEIKNDDLEVNRVLLDLCGYYLHCANEPQATAILEGAARGLVPLITDKAGFLCPDAVYLSENDPEENRRIIADALAMSDEEYNQRSFGVRQHVRVYHSWERICTQMFVAIRALMAGQDIGRRGDDYS